jgi:hypothetical protein
MPSRHAGISRISGNLSQLGDQHSPVCFILPMASDSTFFVIFDQFSCFLGPAKQTTLAYTFGFAHTAEFRNRDLWLDSRHPGPSTLPALHFPNVSFYLIYGAENRMCDKENQFLKEAFAKAAFFCARVGGNGGGPRDPRGSHSGQPCLWQRHAVSPWHQRIRVAVRDRHPVVGERVVARPGAATQAESGKESDVAPL